MSPDISVSAAATLSLAKTILDLVILLYSKITPPPNETDLNNDLNFIKDEFMMMRAYLADAAKASAYRTEAARAWIMQVRNLAYDVEDYFQEFVLHLRTTKKPQNPRKQRNTVVDQIRGLKGRICETNQRYKDSFPALATGGVARDPPQKLFVTMDALLVGRETEKSHIIQIVNKDDKRRQIIPIWGMCGLGKTALAQSICQQRDIISKFKMCAGITLSHPLMVDEVIRSLIYQLRNEEWTYKETLKKMEHEDLIEELNKLLHKEKHLIVLDNVSSIDNWKDLIKLFPDELTASRIIVTTREKTVAEHCSRENMYKLEAMKDDDALELFMNKVNMKAEHFDGQPQLFNQARSIVLKCRGVPLAISTIGSFLATRPRTVQEWANFTENFHSEPDRNSSLKILKTSLTSHCKELPYHLKLCFLYLSIFCEDQNMIRRKCLIRRWIAEGYLGDTNAEENGEVYLADFINKGIILPSPPVYVGGVATIRYCRVHSLLREISLAQSMEEKFCFVLGSRSSSSQTCYNVRHLSISSSWRRDANNLSAIGDISRVRSLTVCGKWEPALELLEKMRMLRVLDLAGTGELLRDHHIEPHLDKLIHLKYLSLRGCRNIFWLTHSLDNLWDLQTLDVRGTSMIILPQTIVNLEKLQYLRAGQIPKDEKTTDCMGSAAPKTNKRLTLGGVMKGVIINSFRSEPKDSGEASKRDTFNKTFFYDGHLLYPTRDKHGIEVPNGTRKLNSLETLGVIDIGAREDSSEELRKLTKLRKLGVTGLNRENSQQFFSAIAMLTLLQSLSIRSEGKPGLQNCLDGKSSSPPTYIRSLKLYGNLITLPSWILHLQNLTKLKLRSTRLGPDAVYVLERLPRLAILRLLSNSIEGKDLRFHFQHGSFRSLVLLQFDGLPYLQSIKFEQGATPNLELLQVENCTDIEKHGCSGLSYLPSLKELWLKAGSDSFMHDLQMQLERNPNRSILKVN